MKVERVIEKKGVKLNITINEDLVYFLQFNGDTLLRAKKEELFKGVPFRDVKSKAVAELNRLFGITDKKKYCNGMRMASEEEIKIVNDMYSEMEILIKEKKIDIKNQTENFINNLTDDSLIGLKFTTSDKTAFIYFKDAVSEEIIKEVRRDLSYKYEIEKIKEDDFKKADIKIKDFYWGDYTNETTYEVTINQLKEIIKISKDRIKNEEENKKIAKVEKDKKEEQIKKDNYFYELESKVVETLETTNEDFGVKVEIKDKNTDEKRTYICRNIFDFGYVVNLEKGGFAKDGDLFDKKADKFLNTFPPISTSIRM